MQIIIPNKMTPNKITKITPDNDSNHSKQKLRVIKQPESLNKELLSKLVAIGYAGNFTLNNIIDWIRNTKNFDIWIEHGSTNKDETTHDVTTSLGCHRGSYKKYRQAQIEAIKIYLQSAQSL